MKKLICTTLGVALLSSVFATGVEAAKPNAYTKDVYATLKAGALLSEKELNRYLTNAGYPDEVISILELEQKQDIYNEQAVYAYHKKQSSNLQEGDNLVTTDLQNGIEAVAPEQMTNFTGTLIASRVTTPSVYGKVEYLLDFNWNWNHDAIVNLMDKFGIAWTDDFNSYPGSAKYAYRAFGYSRLYNEYAETTTGTIVTYTDGSAAGIGWEYDILDFFYSGLKQMNSYRHKGWGQVKIGRWVDKYRAGNYESTQAVGTYFHKEFTASGTLAFDGTRPSVGIDATSSYDKADDILSDPFSWMHYSY